MRKNRYFIIPVAVLLLMSVCACAGDGADAAPEAPPETAMPEPTPASTQRPPS